MSKSPAKKLADDLATILAGIVGERATVASRWHPDFETREVVTLPIVNVRPATRSATRRERGVGIEIGILKKLTNPESSTAEPINNAELDELDALADELFELFVAVDPDELPDGSAAGSLHRTSFGEWSPAGIEQPQTVFNDVLHQEGKFFTFFTVTYKRHV